MNIKDVIPEKITDLYWALSKYRLINTGELYKMWEAIQLQKLLAFYDVDCVLDVGANYGQYAGMLRKRAKFDGLIISFEPLPDAAAALRKKSAGDSKWIIQEQALAAQNGETTLNIMSSSQFSSLSTPRHDEVDVFRDSNRIEKSVSVKTETLASAYHRLKETYKFQRPFLKMDTQGYDIEIVTHSKSVMKEFVGLQSELAVKKIYENSIDFREAINIYQACGFELSAFVPNNSGHFPRLIETDCIMVRQDLMAK